MSGTAQSARRPNLPQQKRRAFSRFKLWHDGLPRWQYTLTVAAIALFLGLLFAELVGGWDDLDGLLSNHSRVIAICLGFLIVLAAIHSLAWSKCWSYVISRQPNQIAIALVLITASLAIVVARIEGKRDIETATVFLFVGLMSAWFAKTALGLAENALFVAILIVPLITYLALTGRLSVVELPGGTKVQFEGIAEKQIQSGAATLLLPASTAKGSGSAECGTFKTVGEGEVEFVAPQADEVTVAIPSQLASRISVGGLQSYLQRYPALRYFVIVSPDCLLVAFGEIDSLKAILTTTGASFLQDASRGQFALLSKYPGISNASIAGEPTVAEAIDALDSQRVDAIAVVGSEVGRFQGIVDRDHIIDQVLLSMLGVATRTPAPAPSLAPLSSN